MLNKITYLLTVNRKLGLGKRLEFMSGLTLPAAVARERHRKPTRNHTECHRVLCIPVSIVPSVHK